MRPCPFKRRQGLLAKNGMKKILGERYFLSAEEAKQT